MRDSADEQTVQTIKATPTQQSNGPINEAHCRTRTTQLASQCAGPQSKMAPDCNLNIRCNSAQTNTSSRTYMLSNPETLRLQETRTNKIPGKSGAHTLVSASGARCPRSTAKGVTPGIFQPRSGPLARLPLGRGRHRWYFR